MYCLLDYCTKSAHRHAEFVGVTKGSLLQNQLLLKLPTIERGRVRRVRTIPIVYFKKVSFLKMVKYFYCKDIAPFNYLSAAHNITAEGTALETYMLSQYVAWFQRVEQHGGHKPPPPKCTTNAAATPFRTPILITFLKLIGSRSPLVLYKREGG